MVSVTHSVATQNDLAHSLQTICAGLSPENCSKIHWAAEFAQALYGERVLLSGENAWHHALGMALIVAGLKLDANCRLASLLCAVPIDEQDSVLRLSERFGLPVAHLVRGLSKLQALRPFLSSSNLKTSNHLHSGETSPEPSTDEKKAQTEIFRKMLLAMVEDVRVVLLRLASRTQTMRYYAEQRHEATPNTTITREAMARETLDLYAPLANRLGVWELKWELEDLSFRFLFPDLYRKIAHQLDEKRVEREQFIHDALLTLRHELEKSNIKNAEIYGRPKHIYSIWNKMRQKGVAFSEVHDVRALRIIVPEIADCYAALSLVHQLWQPIASEFDDYIANPKGNNYRSLHTAVSCADGRSLEVQIRTPEMHRHAELGIAAHWRYKEGKDSSDGVYNEKIAWLRLLLAWKDEVSDTSHSPDWVEHYKEAALDEMIYVLTPQGRVIDLPQGSTPVDFAYSVHTDLGHRCRGAKVDGILVTLNTPLKTSQRIEIIAAKQGGPSRDWLNPTLAYLASHRARAKVRQWFAGLAIEQSVSDGRNIVNRELQRMGETNLRIDDLASKLGFAKNEDLFIALARAELNLRQLQVAVRGNEAETDDRPFTEAPVRKQHASDKSEKGILIVGIDKLLTQLAGCCKPAPPDPIIGFVTRGKGVSIHRTDCPNFAHMHSVQPERVIETGWGVDEGGGGVFAVDIMVEANDRQGLLRDISEVLTREKMNVIAVSTQSKHGMAHMRFTAEISHLKQLAKTLLVLHEVSGVVGVRRA